jgi:hypothetical protein
MVATNDHSVDGPTVDQVEAPYYIDKLIDKQRQNGGLPDDVAEMPVIDPTPFKNLR